MITEQSTPFLSVVIPVYNMGTELGYLRTCLASVRAQSFRDIEIIVVDDGSTDQTGNYLREAQAEDERIRLVHCSANRGAGYARNMGVEVARGDYVWYVDSDDWMHPQAVSTVARVAAHLGHDRADVFYIGHREGSLGARDGAVHPCPDPDEGRFDVDTCVEVWDRKQAFRRFSTFSLAQNPWLSVVRTGLARQLRFDRLSAGQDVACALGLYAMARRVAHVKWALYVHRERDGSISKRQTRDISRSTLRSCVAHARICDAIDRTVERYQLDDDYARECFFYREWWRHQVLARRVLYAGARCDHVMDWYRTQAAPKAGLGVALACISMAVKRADLDRLRNLERYSHPVIRVCALLYECVLFTLLRCSVRHARHFTRTLAPALNALRPLVRGAHRN